MHETVSEWGKQLPGNQLAAVCWLLPAPFFRLPGNPGPICSSSPAAAAVVGLLYYNTTVLGIDEICFLDFEQLTPGLRRAKTVGEPSAQSKLGKSAWQAHTHRCVGRRSLALPNTSTRKRGGAQLAPLGLNSFFPKSEPN